jgi:hypothetical protein
MADYYTHLSFVVPIQSDEELAWIRKTLSEPPRELLFIAGDEFEDLEFRWDLVENSLWIYSDDHVNTEQLIQFLTLYLQQPCCKHHALGFQWAYTCSKMRTDGFGGGAVRLKKDPSAEGGVDQENLDTNFFLEEWSIP